MERKPRSAVSGHRTHSIYPTVPNIHHRSFFQWVKVSNALFEKIDAIIPSSSDICSEGTLVRDLAPSFSSHVYIFIV